MKSKRIILKLEIGIEILNVENFNDFATQEQAKFLCQEMLDQSTWPGEGIGCEVISVEVEEV